MLLKALLIVAIPLAALLVGGAFLAALPASGKIRDAAAGKPLYRKLTGYDAGMVATYWDALNKKDALAGERSVLIVDLAYPLVYGGGFAMALLAAWLFLGLPIHPGWLLAPVLILVAADWTENLVMLGQLDQFMAVAQPGQATTSDVLSASWIRVASLATSLKWVFFAVSSLVTIALAVCVGRQP